MPIDPKPSDSSASKKSREGWLAKCGHLISTLSVRDSTERAQDDPNRLVTRSAKRAGAKRKRSPQHNISPRSTMPKQNGAPVSPAERLKNAEIKFAEKLQSKDQQEEYANQRTKLLNLESASAWDKEAKRTATDKEVQAGEIIRKIRENERDVFFGNVASEDIPGEDTLDMGGQFLTNKSRIEKSKIFEIATEVPKGAIQHLHFNAELHPEKLIEQARYMDNMFIQSKRPLTSKEHFALTEVIFNVLEKDSDKGTEEHDIFSEKYGVKNANGEDFKVVGKPMQWKKFCQHFPAQYKKIFGRASEDDFGSQSPANVPQDSSAEAPIMLNAAEKWIKSKMVLNEEEAYGMKQTVNGVWARFNQATRCFKGLFNYKKVFQWYIDNAIDAMIAEKIMYAELRPMLMDKTIPDDDGVNKLGHDEQMELILKCVKEKQKKLKDEGKGDKFPFGVKIIYCTPRSIPKERMKKEMQDCINLKIKFPDLICGFDLVGAEDRANHIGFYYEELVAFSETCKELGLDIPFLFHAGETLLDTGGSKDTANSNLYDAALLNAKRIGHGFSLLKHPQLVQEFKKKNICIELCPISNELLHLCRNVKEHPFPQLLAAGIPCSLNSDNPSLFRGARGSSNSMSHEFYQVMVGSPAMSIHGWKQLALWSIEYSCLSEGDKKIAEDIFYKEWDKFCDWVVKEYKAVADKLTPDGKPKAAQSEH